MRRIFLLAPLLLAPGVAAETVVLEAARDATLIEQADGALASGSGPRLFVGRTAQDAGAVRRALVFFDVAAALPPGAIVEEVALTLYMRPSNPTPREVRLHRLLADWGEGASSSGGGGGDEAATGDATWLHTVYPDRFWVRPGGQFLGRASATRRVGATGFYRWRGGPHLLQDVRLWSRSPRANHGWILVGDETTPQSVKSFAAREDPDFALRPRLEIRYRLPGR